LERARFDVGVGVLGQDLQHAPLDLLVALVARDLHRGLEDAGLERRRFMESQKTRGKIATNGRLFLGLQDLKVELDKTRPSRLAIWRRFRQLRFPDRRKLDETR